MSNDFYRLSILPHVAIVIKICRAYTNAQEDFEDYYQEVCLQIWRSKDNFQEQCEWSTWVYKISLNVSISKTNKTICRHVCRTWYLGECVTARDIIFRKYHLFCLKLTDGMNINGHTSP